MNFTSGLPVAAIVAALIWYGSSNLIRSDHTSSGSPIDTHTSVIRTSHPSTDAATSSLTVILAPVSSAHRARLFDDLVAGLQRTGAADADSMPSFAAPIR